MKKIISLALVSIIITASCVFSVLANEVNTNYGLNNAFETVTLDSQMERILSNPNLTDENKYCALEQYMQSVNSSTITNNKTISENNNQSRYAISKYLDVPFFNQILSYYCGPATTKQTYSYWNNRLHNSSYSPTLDSIAESIETSATSGTDLNNMANYINQCFHCSYTVLYWWADASSMADTIVNAIDNDIPPMLHISVNSTYSNGWRYTTTGHYLNISGYLKVIGPSTTSWTFTVVDPYYDGHNISTGTYRVSQNDVFDYHLRMAY